MISFKADTQRFEAFLEKAGSIKTNLSKRADKTEIVGLEKIIENFKRKTEDFYRENRKLNIGVIGQVKAGKSSFLNTLLFEGEEILPKASTPKTANLTKMEYSQNNIIEIEYYSVDEWEVLEENAKVDLDDDIYTSAREIVEMVERSGIDCRDYLGRGKEQKEFDTYEHLIENLNDYVGEDGKFTPLVKAVTLYLNKEEFKGLSIVDTPGLNDPIASRTIRTKEFMELCDVVFFLSQSGSFLDKSDWTLLSTQLPQKGVKKLVLIASKYDSGIRDILRIQEEDDIFGEDENVADNIPKACKIIRKKLKKRAKSKVEEFVKDLEGRDSSKSLIDVIRQCSEPILVSSLCHNMMTKSEEELSSEERNIYSALSLFSKNMKDDLKLLSNFDEVKEIFSTVIEEKESIFEKKSKEFIPNAVTELKTLLESYKEKAAKRLKIIEEGDNAKLSEQKKSMEAQMNKVKSDIMALFMELGSQLETEKVKSVAQLRRMTKDYNEVKTRQGVETIRESYTVSDSKWYKPWTWGKSHTEYNTYDRHYSYCIANDAVDNLHKYSVESVNQAEKLFLEAINLRGLKRRLFDVILDNFNTGSEKYDASLFRMIIEESIRSIEFPVFKLDITDSMNSIVTKFSGEIVSSDERVNLQNALYKALSKIYDELINAVTTKVKEFRSSLEDISKKVQVSLLEDVTKEFELLIEQCKNKEIEIRNYKEYLSLLEKELSGLK